MLLLTLLAGVIGMIRLLLRLLLLKPPPDVSFKLRSWSEKTLELLKLLLFKMTDESLSRGLLGRRGRVCERATSVRRVGCWTSGDRLSTCPLATTLLLLNGSSPR